MKIMLRRATEADAKHAASLLTELGYPSTEAEARNRLAGLLRSATSCCLVAESAAEVIGLISAELVFYFPTGSTICRITALVVSSQHRGQGLGQKLLAAATETFALSTCNLPPWAIASRALTTRLRMAASS